MSTTTPRMHRTTLARNVPFPFSAKGLTEMVYARYAYLFGTANPPELYLVHAGHGWDGTFRSLLRKTLDDVLNNDTGADPWPLSLMADKSRTELETVAGHATRYEGETDEVIFADGSRVAVDDIVAIAV